MTTVESAKLLSAFQRKQQELSDQESAYVTFLVQDNSCVVVVDGDYTFLHRAKNYLISFSYKLREKSVKTGYPITAFTIICGSNVRDTSADLQNGQFATIVGNTGETINRTSNFKELLKYRNWYLPAIEEDLKKPL